MFCGVCSLCNIQIGNILIVETDGWLVGWVEEGRVVVNRKMAKRGREGEHLVMGVRSVGKSCGQGLEKKTEMGAETEEREKGSKKTRSVYTKKCSASDSRIG